MPTETRFAPEPIERVQVVSPKGDVDEGLLPDIDDDTLVRLYRTMVLSRRYDQARLRLQRQGRIGTFAPAEGQEAAMLGSVAVLRDTDWMVPSYREVPSQVWRGMRLEDDLLYCAGFEEGVRLGDRDLPICIPVGSQVPHAVGLAWGLRLQHKDEVVLVYHGDGATSEGDFHEGLNFAALFDCPVVLLCQNNQYAISVPRQRQTRSETLAQKALAYGVPGVQVDGNDLWAVYGATREAVDRAREGGGPTLIEAVTYRLGVHTTADDPGKYRSEEEEDKWRRRDPLPRLRDQLEGRGLWDGRAEEELEDEVERQIKKAVSAFESRARTLLDPRRIFDHAYLEEPATLRRQRESLAAAWRWAQEHWDEWKDHAPEDERSFWRTAAEDTHTQPTGAAASSTRAGGEEE